MDDGGIFVSEVAVKVDARFRRQKVKLSLSILLVGVLSRGAHRREFESLGQKHFYIRFERTNRLQLVPITRTRLSIIDREDPIRYPRFSMD